MTGGQYRCGQTRTGDFVWKLVLVSEVFQSCFHVMVQKLKKGIKTYQQLNDRRNIPHLVFREQHNHIFQQIHTQWRK